MTSELTDAELLVERRDEVAWLTLNRPGRRNALSESLVLRLDETLESLGQDDSVRVVVITAEGPVFCSGHDLGEMTGRSEDEYHALFENCSRMMQRIHQIPQPVIARVQGFATAAGCQLVAACDLAVAVDSAKFATPGVKIGLFCATPMVPLVRNVLPKFAMEMLLTGHAITAEQALMAGLVNRVVPEIDLNEVVHEWCAAICSTSTVTIRLGKRAFYEQLYQPEALAYRQAVEIMTHNALKQDAQEGISAFLEKRPPQWKGE